MNEKLPCDVTDTETGDVIIAANKKIKRSKIEDRKGRTVVVQRTGSDEKRARNEAEANGYGPPRKPKRGYHGKRDLTPKD